MNFTIVDNSLIEEITPYLYIGKNYPNPFNSRTKIPIVLTQSTNIQLSVFGLNGAKVKELYSGVMVAGLTEVVWDGTNTQGKQVSAGVYFYQLDLNSVKQTVKPMLYLK